MATVKKKSRVEKKVWGPGDIYLIIPEIQVFREDGFKEGDIVEVTIRKKER